MALKYNLKLYLWDIDTGEYLSSEKKLSLKVKPPPPLVKKAPPLISKAPALPQGDAQLEKDTVKPKKPGKGLQAAPVPPIAVLSLPSAPNISKPKPVKKKIIQDRPKPKPVKKKRIRRPSTNMRSALTKRLGPHKTNAILFIIDSRIKVYSMQTKSDVKDFLVRSYQRYYRKRKLSPKQAVKLMQKGIAHPGSLEAIVKNMKREFPEAPIRNYSFSKIFSISRSQAKALFSGSTAHL